MTVCSNCKKNWDDDSIVLVQTVSEGTLELCANCYPAFKRGKAAGRVVEVSNESVKTLLVE